MNKATFYHAGCPVCVEAEHKVLEAIDKNKYTVEVIHLGEDKDKITEAENIGIKSVPALVIDGAVLHINYGAGIADLK